MGTPEIKSDFVLVSESVELSRPSREGLMETFDKVFSTNKKMRITRMLYDRGEPLLVERRVPKDAVAASEGIFTTPFEMLRNYGDIEIQESGKSASQKTVTAAQTLANSGYVATLVICQSREQIREWSKGFVVWEALRLEVFEDLDVPDGLFFLCGSRTGPMLQHIEYAVGIRVE